MWRIMEKTVERAAVHSISLPTFRASAPRSSKVAPLEVIVADETSDLMVDAASGLTGGRDPTWALALAREKGYVIVDAIALLTAAMRNVTLALGSSLLALGNNVRLNVS